MGSYALKCQQILVSMNGIVTVCLHPCLAISLENLCAISNLRLKFFFFSEKIVSKHKTHSRFFCLFHKKRVIYGHCYIQTRSYLSSCLQIHSKWIKDLNVIQWNSEIYNGKEGFCLIRASLIPHLRSFLMWCTAVNAETHNSSKCIKQVSVG